MDRKQPHSSADCFSMHADSGMDAAKALLEMFDDVKAIYTEAF